MIFSGLDLAGYKRKEKTVLSFINGGKVKILKGLDDKEIVENVILERPTVFAIDAPLSFPKKGIFRYSDKKLKKILDKKNIRYLKKSVLPPVLPQMKIITKRAIKIKNSLKGIRIIETHPTICIFLILFEKGIDIRKFISYKKNKEVFENLVKILQKILGYRLKFSSPDELDSFICAYMAKLFYKTDKTLYLSKTKSPFIIYNF